jgi:hypothetical protein
VRTLTYRLLALLGKTFPATYANRLGEAVQLETPDQIGWTPSNFVATSTSRIVAVLRIVPQIVRIASVTVVTQPPKTGPSRM